MTDDTWILQENQRFLTLRASLHHLQLLRDELHNAFMDKINSDGEWPFGVVRTLQSCFEKNHWALLTSNPQEASQFLAPLKHTADRHATELACKLLDATCLTLDEHSGNDIKNDPNTLKNIEICLSDIEAVAGLLSHKNPELERQIHLVRHTMRSMYDDETPCPPHTQKLLAKSLSGYRAVQPDTTSPPSRYDHAHAWTGLANAHLQITKTALALDYGAHAKKLATPLSDDFHHASLLELEIITTDSYTARDLQRANDHLYRAFTAN